MNKTNNLRAYLRDLYEGIVSKKPDASRNPQNFRSEIEAIRTGGEFYEVMDASELPLDAPDGSLALVEVEVVDDVPRAYTVSSVDELPSDAVDGSMAIVESDSDILGTYRLNSSANLENLTHLIEPDAYYEWTVKGYATNRDGIKTQFAYIYIAWDSDGKCDGVGVADDDLGTDTSLYINTADPLSAKLEWADRITIEEEPTDNDAITFIRDNCVKTNPLYIHENGEWVYKGEVA